MEWTDTHAHLEDGRFSSDLDEVVRRAEEAGVKAILTAGTDLKTSRAAVELAERYGGVWAAVGVHPHEAEKATPEVLAEVEELASHEKVVAVGEVGLDFYRDRSPRESQLTAFRRQVELAGKLGLPLVVHSRGAVREVLDLLKEFRGIRGVLHCFPGGLEEAEEALELGWYVGIGGTLTFPKSALPEVVSALPLEGILLETDSPYLAPVPHRGRRNEPAYLVLVGEKLARIKDTSPQEVALCTTENARKLFGFPPASP
ncbi:MAG: hydrolase TatD [Candidatus Latescibacterota bacterium]|nr:MAG: hydrolase TatD [Candidatus Latescibacterota bacterium]RKY70169.1 MAG: hydrolase TatD [Candidatus Latescibacterota bacterium]